MVYIVNFCNRYNIFSMLSDNHPNTNVLKHFTTDTTNSQSQHLT